MLSRKIAQHNLLCYLIAGAVIDIIGIARADGFSAEAFAYPPFFFSADQQKNTGCFTTKELDKGTGLGQAMVYGIVKQNNGFINVYSEPDHGTTFKIYLPQHAAKAFPRTEPKQAQVAVTGGETILLVEDELDILKMSSMMLEGMGYTVIAAGTPGEAIRLAREHQGRIDLLMTNVVMPEMNGRDLAKAVSTLYPGLRFLFMSGYTANVEENCARHWNG